MQSNLRFVVCTRDSAPWIGQFLTAYRSLGIEPLYIHDVRSVDATRNVLQRAGAEVIDFDPAGDYVEAGMIKFGAMRAKSEWVFRIDDDEFPSLALVRWLANEGVFSRVPAVICSRRDVFRRGGNYAYTRHPNRYFNAEAPHYLGPHHRLFRPRMVSYSERLHSPGFTVPPPFEFAPQDAFFIHCNCLVRSVGQRLAKLRRYEAISPLSSWKFADEYVPELFETSTAAASDGLDEFAPLLATLQALAEEEAEAVLKPGELGTIESEVARERQAVAHQASAYKKRLARQVARYGEPVGHGLNRYRTTLAAGIDFTCPGLPEFLSEVKGLSISEHWGRWSEGPQLVLVFDRALPDSFLLKLAARPFGPNINRDIAVTVGCFSASMRLTEYNSVEHRIHVKDHGRADTICFSIPDPTAPSSLGSSTDKRLLGIGITSLKIEQEQRVARVRTIGRELLIRMGFEK